MILLIINKKNINNYLGKYQSKNVQIFFQNENKIQNYSKNTNNRNSNRNNNNQIMKKKYKILIRVNNYKKLENTERNVKYKNYNQIDNTININNYYEEKEEVFHTDKNNNIKQMKIDYLLALNKEYMIVQLIQIS